MDGLPTTSRLSSFRNSDVALKVISFTTGSLLLILLPYVHLGKYEGCSNMNASGFITFFTYMLRQNGKRFYKGLYVTFKVAPDLKKNTVYLSSYIPLNEGHVCILTNSMLRTYTNDRDERRGVPAYTQSTQLRTLIFECPKNKNV